MVDTSGSQDQLQNRRAARTNPLNLKKIKQTPLPNLPSTNKKPQPRKRLGFSTNDLNLHDYFAALRSFSAAITSAATELGQAL